MRWWVGNGRFAAWRWIPPASFVRWMWSGRRCRRSSRSPVASSAVKPTGAPVGNGMTAAVAVVGAFDARVRAASRRSSRRYHRSASPTRTTWGIGLMRFWSADRNHDALHAGSLKEIAISGPATGAPPPGERKPRPARACSERQPSPGWSDHRSQASVGAARATPWLLGRSAAMPRPWSHRAGRPRDATPTGGHQWSTPLPSHRPP